MGKDWRCSQSTPLVIVRYYPVLLVQRMHSAITAQEKVSCRCMSRSLLTKQRPAMDFQSPSNWCQFVISVPNLSLVTKSNQVPASKLWLFSSAIGFCVEYYFQNYFQCKTDWKKLNKNYIMQLELVCQQQIFWAGKTSGKLILATEKVFWGRMGRRAGNWKFDACCSAFEEWFLMKEWRKYKTDSSPPLSRSILRNGALLLKVLFKN